MMLLVYYSIYCNSVYYIILNFALLLHKFTEKGV